MVCDGFCSESALLPTLQARKLLSQRKDFLLTGEVGWGVGTAQITSNHYVKIYEYNTVCKILKMKCSVRVLYGDVVV